MSCSVAGVIAAVHVERRFVLKMGKDHDQMLHQLLNVFHSKHERLDLAASFHCNDRDLFPFTCDPCLAPIPFNEALRCFWQTAVLAGDSCGVRGVSFSIGSSFV